MRRYRLWIILITDFLFTESQEHAVTTQKVQSRIKNQFSEQKTNLISKEAKKATYFLKTLRFSDCESTLMAQ